MPSYKDLKVGDKIVIHSITPSEIEWDKSFDAKGMTTTLEVLQQLVKTQKTLTIDHIDEHGYPWYEYFYQLENGETEDHWLAVMDNESWSLSPATDGS